MKTNGVENNREKFIKEINTLLSTTYKITSNERYLLQTDTKNHEKLIKEYEETKEKDSNLVNSDRYQKEYDYNLYIALYNRRKIEFIVLSKKYHIERLLAIKNIMNNPNNKTLATEQLEEYFEKLKAEIILQYRMKRLIGQIKILLSGAINKYIEVLQNDLINEIVIIEMRSRVIEFKEKYRELEDRINKQKILIENGGKATMTKEELEILKERVKTSQSREITLIDKEKNELLNKYRNEFENNNDSKISKSNIKNIINKCDELCEKYDTKILGQSSSSTLGKIKMIRATAKEMIKNILTEKEVAEIRDENIDLSYNCEKYLKLFESNKKYPFHKELPLEELITQNGEDIIDKLLFDKDKESKETEIQSGKGRVA